MVKNCEAYHRNVFNRHGCSRPDTDFVKPVVTHDNVTLACTVKQGESDIGIVLVPGLTVPRESCYKLMSDLDAHPVLTYDIRGQGGSEGAPSCGDSMLDTVTMATVLKSETGAARAVYIGHSYSGAIGLAAAGRDNPYDLVICMASPVYLKKHAGRIPAWLPCLLRSGLIHLYNMKRQKTSPCMKDEIVCRHQPDKLTSLVKNPRIVALDVRDAVAYQRMRMETPSLLSSMAKSTTPFYLIYAGNDDRLNIRKDRLTEEYGDLETRIRSNGLAGGISLLPGLSHRFNKQDDEFMISHDNQGVSDLITERISRL